MEFNFINKINNNNNTHVYILLNATVFPIYELFCFDCQSDSYVFLLINQKYILITKTCLHSKLASLLFYIYSFKMQYYYIIYILCNSIVF